MKKSYNNQIEIKRLIFIVITYFIMHGGALFILNSIFWDDWLLYSARDEAIINLFSQAGSIFSWSGHVHTIFQKIGLWSYRILTLILMLCSGLLMNLFLTEKSELISNEQKFLLVLLFLILPFNMARVAIINFPSALTYFAFFLAWYLLGKNKFYSILFFLFSFNLNSLLVFYAVPITLLFIEGGYYKNIKSIIYFISRNILLLIIPFIYFYIKVKISSPYGIYNSYNENYSLENIYNGVNNQINEFQNLRVNYILFLLIFILVFFQIKKLIFNEYLYKNNNSLKLFFLGLYSLLLSIIPYVIIGEVPTFSEWTSRHQILMPFGASLLIVSFISVIKNTQFRVFIVASVVSFSLSYGVEAYYKFYVDWRKQESIINLLNNDLIIKNYNLIIINDKSTEFNAINRKYRFYEWNSIFSLAYQDQRFFVISPSDIIDYLNGDFDKYFIEAYKASRHHRKNNTSALYIEIQMTPGFMNIYGFGEYKLILKPIDYPNVLNYNNFPN